MSRWQSGQYREEQIAVPGNEDLFLDCTFIVQSFKTKLPWNELENKVKYEVSLWLRVSNLKCDEIQLKCDEKKLIEEFKPILDKKLDEIWHLINFSDEE